MAIITSIQIVIRPFKVLVEFTIELFWSTLKKALALEGVETSIPKDVLRLAFANQWIHDEEVWLKMRDDRNKASHT